MLRYIYHIAITPPFFRPLFSFPFSQSQFPSDDHLISPPNTIYLPYPFTPRELTQHYLNNQEKKSTAGPEWFHLPRTNLSDKLKTDLKLLGMRAVLDPKRHYRKEKFNPDGPKFSQVGTIIEGPTEFFSARLRNKERKQTIVEEVMAGEAETGRFKREYLKRQVAKTSGRRKFYRELKAKRFRQRK